MKISEYLEENKSKARARGNILSRAVKASLENSVRVVTDNSQR